MKLRRVCSTIGMVVSEHLSVPFPGVVFSFSHRIMSALHGSRDNAMVLHILLAFGAEAKFVLPLLALVAFPSGPVNPFSATTPVAALVIREALVVSNPVVFVL